MMQHLTINYNNHLYLRPDKRVSHSRWMWLYLPWFYEFYMVVLVIGLEVVGFSLNAENVLSVWSIWEDLCTWQWNLHPITSFLTCSMFYSVHALIAVTLFVSFKLHSLFTAILIGISSSFSLLQHTYSRRGRFNASKSMTDAVSYSIYVTVCGR